jgi:chromosome segregation ATPase
MAEATQTSKKEISELQERLQILTSESNSKIATLQEQLNQAQSARDDAEESISLLKAKIGQLTEHAERDAQHIQQLEQTSSTIQERVASLEAEIASANHKHQELISSKEAAESALKQEVAGLQDKLTEDASKSASQISELESTIIVIRQQCELHSAELTQMKEAVVEKDSQLSKLASIQHEAEELKGTSHNRDQTIKELRDLLSAAESKVHDFEGLQTTQAEELDQLKKDHSRTLAEYEGRLQEMTKGATTNASRHAVLENDVSSLTSKIAALEADLLAVQSERDRVQKEHEEYVDSTSHQNDSEMFELHGQMESLEEQLRKSQETREALEAQLAGLRQSLSSEGPKSSEAEKQLEASLREAEDKVVDLQLELDTKNTSLAELESEANKATELESQLQRLNQELDSLKAKSETEVTDLRAQITDLKNQNTFSEQARSNVSGNTLRL